MLCYVQHICCADSGTLLCGAAQSDADLQVTPVADAVGACCCSAKHMRLMLLLFVLLSK